MDHIAIMNQSLGLISKILSNEKTIESRWYANKVAPWDRISKGDTIYFKNSGEQVIAKAEVNKVLQFENLDAKLFSEIVSKYADQIQLMNRIYDDYYKAKNYCILVFLKNSQRIEKPFTIDKTGYGNACAWMCVGDVRKVIVN